MAKSHYKARLARSFIQLVDMVTILIIVVCLKEYFNSGQALDLKVLIQITFSFWYFVTLICLVFIWRYVFVIMGMYEFRRAEGWGKRIGRVFLACSVGVIVLIGISFLLGVKGIRGESALLLWAWTVGTIMIIRSAAFIILQVIRSRGRNLLNVVIVGLNERSRSMCQRLKESGQGFNLMGFFDDLAPIQMSDNHDGLPFLGTMSSFGNYVSKEAVDQVIIALPIRSYYDDISKIIRDCALQGIETWMLADLFEVSSKTELGTDRVGTTHFVKYQTRSLSEIIQDAKRLLDIILSSLAIIALSPVALILSILILLDSGPPVFFVQERIGLNKRRFKMLKFRTMVREAEEIQASLEDLNEADGAVFKLINDPRITRVGRLLRKTSLDEIPQFVNVLLGSMSLVGPRPLPGRDFERFYDSSHRLRFSVKPGITGLWQVSGRSDVDFEEWMKLDTFYVHNWSLLLDILILLRTIKAVLVSKGAY
ncbi:MAG: sugar transferase [Deltaproteobacteria bacterium]|nr:sugar transferase [Deltaproteobacteria bacterium]